MMPSLIGPKIAIFGGKIDKFCEKNREKWENIYLLIYLYKILHSGS